MAKIMMTNNNESFIEAHICLAALRAVAFQCTEMLEAIEHDMENTTKINTLKVIPTSVSHFDSLSLLHSMTRD